MKPSSTTAMNIPGNPKVWGVRFFGAKLIVGTEDGVYVCADGKCDRLEPTGSSEPVLVNAPDTFMSINPEK